MASGELFAKIPPPCQYEHDLFYPTQRMGKEKETQQTLHRLLIAAAPSPIFQSQSSVWSQIQNAKYGKSSRNYQDSLIISSILIFTNKSLLLLAKRNCRKYLIFIFNRISDISTHCQGGNMSPWGIRAYIIYKWTCVLHWLWWRNFSYALEGVS